MLPKRREPYQGNYELRSVERLSKIMGSEVKCSLIRFTAITDPHPSLSVWVHYHQSRFLKRKHSSNWWWAFPSARDINQNWKSPSHRKGMNECVLTVGIVLIARKRIASLLNSTPLFQTTTVMLLKQHWLEHKNIYAIYHQPKKQEPRMLWFAE